MYKKNYLLTVCLLVITLNSISQSISNYTFTASNGTFSPLSVSTVPSLTGNIDEGYWNAMPLGFDFWYMGTRYTTISASTNGWLTLGSNITNASPVNNLSGGGSPRPVLAPLWDDLAIQAAVKASYLTSGSSGSRVFTFQFLNLSWDHLTSGNAVSIQVKLYEGSGKIEYVYRQETGSVVNASASIGLAATATGSGNFVSLNGTSEAPSKSSTTETATINAKPATGQVYTFTPPVPIIPTLLSYTNISSTGMTLNWADNSTNELGFVIYRSTDGVNYTFVTQTPLNILTSVQNGLTGSTIYYWRIYSITEGALSISSSGSQVTMCSPPAAPTVTTPVAYCQNGTAMQLTATGSNLLWGGISASGTVGGNSNLTTTTYVDAPNPSNNKKTKFTTVTPNVTITSVDFYIPPYQTVSGLVLGLFNNAGTLIATSGTTTSISANATAIKITNTFNYVVATPGNYSIGISAGTGNIGSDNPAYPITETSGTVNITGTSVAGYQCLNNLQFTIGGGSSTAPTPSTAIAGAANYVVTQTISGCVSPQATVTVNTNAPAISQITAANIVANYPFNGNAIDITGNNSGTLQNAPSLTTDRFGVANSAYTFNGSSQYISTANSYNNPGNFSVSIWFKTASASGGKLIGFGKLQTGSSGQYDRHIYMNNTGQVYFGVYAGSVVTVNSTLSYNDNTWHLATATLSATTGMALYIDGAQVGSNTTATAGENYTGYWRIGYDNTNVWTSQPANYYFTGTLDDALIYDRALSASEILALYTSPNGAGNNGPVCSGATLSLNATTLSGATYLWSGPNSFSSSAQNPSFTYLAPFAGVYTLVVTAAGCTATAYTNVSSTANSGQWTGSVSTDWVNAANWCSGIIPTSATNVIISSTATRMPSIISSVFCNNITINTGATLTITSTGTLSIAGLLSNTGTYTDNGTTRFNGTSGQQTFSGVPTFNNLTLNNTSGLLLPVAIVVKNDLTISAGLLDVNAYNITIAGNWINNGSAAALNARLRSVTFNGITTQSIGGTFSTTFYDLIILKTSGTATLGANANVASNLLISAGTFDLGAYTCNRTSAGGTITVSNNTTLKIGSTNTFPVNYTTNTLAVAGTVEYSGTNQTVANQVYGNLKLSSSAGAVIKTFPATALMVLGNLVSTIGTGLSVSYTAAADITVSGIDSIGASTTFNGGSFSHSIRGNWFNDGTFTGSTSTIIFNGPGANISGSGNQNFNNVTIAASFVSFANSSITLSGNLATTGPGSFSQAAGGTLLMTGSATTISGSGIAPDNLTISGSVTTVSSLNITGNLSVSGSFSSGTGPVSMSGISKTLSGSGTKNFAFLSVTGTVTTGADFTISNGFTVLGSFIATAGRVTFTGTSVVSGSPNLYNVTVNGTSLQLSANTTLGIASTFTVTAGTLDVSSTIPNTINFNGTGAQTINAITYCNLTLSNGNTKTAAGNFTTKYDISIGTGTTFNPSTYTHSIYGNWINNGTFTSATSTIQFLGGATAFVTGATTFNILTSNTTGANTQLILNSDISASTVNMTYGVIVTGTNTITITSTRTGPGYIYGNIKRSHTFTIGIAYAFEGPDNTITFSAVSAVTSMTVSVVQTPVADFPFGGAISRYYNIAIPAGTYNATLRLHYLDGELNGSVESSMGLWNYNGSIWGAIGKSANSTVLNYVEQTGLTNITSRWTCSDNSNVVQWNGSVSADWNTAANWTVLQGSASRPPSANDIVNLGTGPFTYHPIISSSANVKNINFGSVQALTLSIASGGSLISGDIVGNWSSNVSHTINVNNQTLTVNGDLLLSDGVNGHLINLNIGGGTVNVSNDLEQSGGANIIFSSNGSLNISGNFDYVNGTFTPATSTVTYTGDNNQDVGGVNYNNLTINKTAAIASINDTLTVAGNLLVTAGEIDNYSLSTITGNVTLATGATMQNFSVLHVGGNWLNNGTFTANGAKIFFDGTGTQTISSSTFNNFNINKPVGTVAELTGNIAVKGDFNILSGTLNVKTFNCNRSTFGGMITVADPGTLIVSANNIPTNFAGVSFGSSSTLILDGTSSQTLATAAAFGHLIFRNGGTKTLGAPITVNGNLTIETGAAFNADVNTITLNGNWINNGLFTPSSSTVVCAGSIKTITGATTFNRLTVTGSYTLLSNTSFNGLLNITSTGAFSSGVSILTTLHGDLRNSGTLYTLGTTTFTGNVLQTLSLINAVQTVALTVNFNGSVSPVLNSTSTPQFGYLNINNTGGVNPSVDWTVLYALTVGPGATFNGGSATHNILGSLTNNGTITSSGTLNFIPAAPVTINMGSSFTSTGRVIFGGAGAISLLGTPSFFYRMLVSNTNAAGITPSNAWIINSNIIINSGTILNAGSYAYQVGGNLTNNGTINCGTSTFTLNGSGVQDLYSLSPFKNLTISKSSGSATLFSDITINGALNFTNGILHTGSNTLVQPAAATITGAAQNTGWVNGKLQKNIATGATIKSFEIGDSTRYTPLSLNFTNVSTSGNLVAFTTGKDHPAISSSVINPTKSVNRYWTIINSGIAFTKFNATFNFVTNDIDAGSDTAAFVVALSNGSSWVTPLIIMPNATRIQATDLTAFGDFAVGEGCNTKTRIFYRTSPYCSSEGVITVALTGNNGGVFSSTAGLSINTSTGAVNVSAGIAGSYVVNYNVPASGGCPVFSTTATVIVSDAPSASISYNASPYCSSAGTAAVLFGGTSGGTFSSTSGLSLDSATGEINLGASSAGTYTVTYMVNAIGGCSVYSTTTTIIITTQPFTNSTYEGNPYCANSGIALAAGTFSGAPGSFASTSGLVINSSTGSVNLATSTTGNYIVAYSVPASGGCTAYTNNTVINIVTPGTWTGAVSSNWSDGGNWLCGATPSLATNVTVPANLSIYPIVTTANAGTNNITIEAGAMVTVTTGILQIAGSITNLGVFNVAAGTIEMRGASTQTIPAGTFASDSIFNLVVSNNVVLSGQQRITGTLSFGTSNKTITTNGYLTLKSTLAGTARVADITNAGANSGNSIAGSVTIERYIPGRRAWHLLSAPLSSTSAPTINSAWQEGVTSGNPANGYGMYITGGSTANGFDQGINANPSVRIYNSSTNVYAGIASTYLPVTSYSGYYVFIRGNRSTDLLAGTAARLTPTVLRMKGTVRTGNLPVNINAANFTLVGNPYPAAVDFHSLTRNNVNDKIYVVDPRMAGTTGTGGYVTLAWNGTDYDITSSVSPVSRYMQSGEAFFVESLDGINPGTLTFKETDKNAAGSDLVFRPVYGAEKQRVDLYAVNSDSSVSLSDGVLTTYNDNNTNTVDRNDARKFFNPGENICLARNGIMLAIERRRTIESDDTTFLNLYSLKKQMYKLLVTTEAMANSGLQAILRDTYSAVTNNTPLNMEGKTDIFFTVNADPDSFAANRFSIIFEKAAPLPVVFETVKACKQQKDVVVQWQCTNEINIKNYEVQSSLNGTTFIKAGTLPAKANNGGNATYNFIDTNAVNGLHYYRIKSTGLNGSGHYSIIVKVNTAGTSGALSVYPNPLTGGLINLQFKNMESGQYKLRLIDINGQQVLNTTFMHPGGSATEKIKLSKYIAKGIYQFEITNPLNGITVINVVNQ